MPSDRNIDWFARIISILSLLIAITAVMVPHYQFRHNLQEAVKVDISSKFNNKKIKLTKIKHVLDEKESKIFKSSVVWTVQVPCEVIISNTSSFKVSLIDYSIGYTYDSFRNMKYNKEANGGIYEAKGNQIKMPIIVDSGETKIYYIYLGLSVPSKVYSLLSNISDNEMVDFNKAKMLIESNGTDLFGNIVTQDNKTTTYYKTIPGPPDFLIDFYSSRGNKFTGKVLDIYCEYTS